jgi:hypothetical protein
MTVVDDRTATVQSRHEALPNVVAGGGERGSSSAEEIGLLCATAEARLAAGDGAEALRLFELAYRMCADEQRRGVIMVRLAHLLWRFNPVAAERLITERLSRAAPAAAPPRSVGPPAAPPPAAAEPTAPSAAPPRPRPSIREAALTHGQRRSKSPVSKSKSSGPKPALKVPPLK